MGQGISKLFQMVIMCFICFLQTMPTLLRRITYSFRKHTCIRYEHSRVWDISYSMRYKNSIESYSVGMKYLIEFKDLNIIVKKVYLATVVTKANQ